MSAFQDPGKFLPGIHDNVRNVGHAPEAFQMFVQRSLKHKRIRLL
jgi:hypothetical protein